MSDAIDGLRVEKTNDGRRAVVADIVGGERLFFGYVGPQVILKIGGAERVAYAVKVDG